MLSQLLELRIQALRLSLASLDSTKNVQHMMCMSYARQHDDAGLQRVRNNKAECAAKMNSYGAEFARSLLMWMDVKAQVW